MCHRTPPPSRAERIAKIEKKAMIAEAANCFLQSGKRPQCSIQERAHREHHAMSTERSRRILDAVNYAFGEGAGLFMKKIVAQFFTSPWHQCARDNAEHNYVPASDHRPVPLMLTETLHAELTTIRSELWMFLSYVTRRSGTLDQLATTVGAQWGPSAREPLLRVLEQFVLLELYPLTMLPELSEEELYLLLNAFVRAQSLAHADIERFIIRATQ